MILDFTSLVYPSLLYIHCIHEHRQKVQSQIRSLIDEHCDPGPEVIKHFSCSAQLRLKFILLINIKKPIVVGILTFVSRLNYRLWHSKPSITKPLVVCLTFNGVRELK